MAAHKAPSTASEIKTLREAVNAQQQQIQMLKDELARRDQAVQQMQGQINQLQSTASQAQSTAQSAASSSKANEDALAALKTNVATVSSTATATATGLQSTEKAVKALESPVAIKYKGITITPGGFISANINWRKNNQNLDNFGSFGALPFDGSSQSHLSELRFTGRYSRISLLAQGKWGSTAMQAYYEMDFQGAAQTANEVQTNSWQPRIREAWVNVDAPHGISFAGGQTWSLLTGNRSGVGVRGLLLPAHINASLIVGYSYARQGTFRVSKKWELANKKAFYWAFSAENPETTSVGAIPAGFTVWGTQGAPVVSPGGAVNCASQTGVTAGLGVCSTFATGLSIDAAPDLLTKVALEPGWGHFELGGIVRFFRDRVALTTNTGNSNAGTNHTTPSGGLFLAAVLPVVPKKVDIWVHALGGRGVGRYNTTGIPDVTFRRDATLQPLLSYGGSVGLETHPTPKLDVMFYAGNEYTQRSPYYTGFAANGLPTAGSIGYGSIGAALNGCLIEIPAAGQACAPANRDVWQVSPGFWYRFHRGPAGTLAYGMFYSHYRRLLWTGNIGTAAAPVFGAPRADQDEILTAFRWYFP